MCSYHINSVNNIFYYVDFSNCLNLELSLQEEHEIRSRFIKLSIILEKLSLSNSNTRGLDYCN